jgi:hypothetical protein
MILSFIPIYATDFQNSESQVTLLASSFENAKKRPLRRNTSQNLLKMGR